MAYIISPPIEYVTSSVGVNAVQPNLMSSLLYLSRGLRQKSQIAPSATFAPLWTGSQIPVSKQIMAHGVPGVTTDDGFFPNTHKPQHRLNIYVNPGPPTYVIAYYHGEPGVLRGDDNWSQEVPSYQPQMRTNTLPHTEQPALVSGYWRVNECFLPSAGA